MQSSHARIVVLTRCQSHMRRQGLGCHFVAGFSASNASKFLSQSLGLHVAAGERPCAAASSC